MASQEQGGTTECCPVCAASEALVCLEVARAPAVVGGLWKSREEALACPQGRIELAVCRRCAAVWNRAFDASLLDYGAGYDNALHLSPVFSKFEAELAERLVERYALHGKDIVEIGSGDGHFLGRLCERAGARGVGFDPSHDPEHADPLIAGSVRVVRGYYGPEYASLPIDALVCRQVLEHVDEPHAFLASLRKLLAKHEGGVGYFEVPNALLSLRDLSVWNIIYEHPVYYTTTTLAHLFRRSGFEVLDVREAYEGQFVSVDVRPVARADAAPPPAAEVDAVLEFAERFRGHFEELTQRWRDRLLRSAAAGERTAVWGAGAKGVSFLNWLGVGDAIDVAVDLNPRKQGTFLAGSGQGIVAPESLVERPPSLVVVMNPIYEDEIRTQLRALGVPARVESL